MITVILTHKAVQGTIPVDLHTDNHLSFWIKQWYLNGYMVMDIESGGE